MGEDFLRLPSPFLKLLCRGTADPAFDPTRAYNALHARCPLILRYRYLRKEQRYRQADPLCISVNFCMPSFLTVSNFLNIVTGESTPLDLYDRDS